MSGDKSGDAIELRRAGKRARFVCVAGSVVCITFSMLASVATADTAGPRKVVGADPHKKTSAKKLGASCDEPSVPKNSHGCLVSLSSVDKLRTQKEFNFVDVRSPAEYDHYRIAGSINIPLHLVKTKEFLKQTSIVLVNDGRNTVELEKTCGELKQSGFESVAILDGGLFAWHTSKRALEGDPIEQSKLNRMSAEELFEVRALENWSVIDLSVPDENKEIRSWLPTKVIAVPFKSKGTSIARISSDISQQRKKNPQGKLLLIADNDDIYERIDAQLKKSGVTSGILRLDGGIKGYREYVTKQLALWSQQNRPRRYETCRG